LMKGTKRGVWALANASIGHDLMASFALSPQSENQKDDGFIPQFSALIMKVRINMALDHILTGDPNAIRVLTEVIARCESLISKINEENRHD
jgi:hypothetical protein